MSIRMWFQVREAVDAASTQALRDVAENEATVESGEFALRLAIQNTGEKKIRARINVIVPVEVGLRVLDEGTGRVPTLPSSVDDLYPGEVSTVRWAVADRKIRPGDFAVLDLAVGVADVVHANGGGEIPIRAVLNDGSDEETVEQIRVRVEQIRVRVA